MENKDKNESFSYTYSASDQAEVRRIREKYSPRTPDKMEQLRMLDRSVARKGTTVSLIVGIVGTLILGMGMSLAMVGSASMFIPGVLVGIVGLAVIAAAYPLYNGITRREREKIAPEIIRLTDELMK